jgi:hypothetical protein
MGGNKHNYQLFDWGYFSLLANFAHKQCFFYNGHLNLQGTHVLWFLAKFNTRMIVQIT